MIGIEVKSIRTKFIIAVFIPLLLFSLLLTFFIVYYLSINTIAKEKNYYNKLISNYRNNIERIMLESMNDGQFLAKEISKWYNMADIQRWNEYYSKCYSYDTDKTIRSKYYEEKRFGIFLSNKGSFNDRVKRMIIATEEKIHIYLKAASLRFFDTYIVMPEQFILIDHENWHLKIPADFDMFTQEWANMVIPQNNPGKKSVWTSVYYDPYLKQWILSNASPIYNGDEYLGSVGHDIMIQDLLKAISSYQHGIPGSKHILINSEGSIIYHPDFEEMLKESPDNFKYTGRRDSVVLNHILKHTSELLTVDAISLDIIYDQEKCVLTCSYMKSIDWYYVQLIPHQVVLSEVYSLAEKIIISFLVIIFLISLLIYVSTNTSVIKPVQEIISNIKQISIGIIPHKISSKYNGEFNEIKENLNSLISNYRETVLMAEKIADGNLNIRVKVRSEKDLLSHSLNKMANNLQIIISRLAEAKENAEAANKAKSTFLASISHELRTPLNAILGYAQILRRDRELKEKHKDQIATMQNSGEYLLSLINDILDHARIESQKEVLELKEFNLLELLQEISSVVRVKALEKELLFNYEEQSTIPKIVKGDARKIKQVLINLLGNAVKYTEAGSVTLKLNCNQIQSNCVFAKSESPLRSNQHQLYSIRFQVEDTGVGIPKNKLDKIFEPFTRIVGKDKTIEGIGLGLAITCKLVNLMGGKISIESKVGKGSAFTFELELEVMKEAEAKAKEAEREVLGYRGERKRLLIVDDNPTNLNMLINVLEPLGFEIDTAENGKQAVEKAAQTMPELILMDYLMPVMNGHEAVLKIKNNEKMKRIKSVGVSAAVADKEQMEKFAEECDDFISKPVNIYELLEKIKEHLNIEWIQEEQKKIALQPVDTNDKQIIFPSDDILSAIILDAEKGDFSALENVLNTLANDETYVLFCNSVREYMRGYDDEGIINFLKGDINK